MNTNFKKKGSSIIKKNPTLEELHSNKLIYFDNLQKSLPKKKKELTRLETSLSIINSDFSSREVYFSLKKEISSLYSVIEKIKSKEEEKKYFINAVPILMKFECCENQSENTTLNHGFFTETVNHEKKKYLTEYLREIGRIDLIDLNLSKNFEYCSCGCSYLIEDLSFLICSECGLVSSRELSNNCLTYKESQETEYISTFYYKRMNHFQECLNQLQAKENTTIPQDVFDVIYDEMSKGRISSSELTIQHIRNFLKKNHKTKYKENSYSIFNRITGHKIVIPMNIEEKLKKMFTDIQKPFEIYKGTSGPKPRRNFLNYNYCFYKFFELLDLPEYLQYFPLLKDRHKLYEHDVIWEKICKDMNWEFSKCR
jgi:hypothetical protein